MLQAKRTSIWKSRYEITSGGHPVAIWDGSMWKSGGRFELEGRNYLVRGNMWGSKYGMATDGDVVVATADRVGRKHWTVRADGQEYTFVRASIWRHEEELHARGRAVGSVRRTSLWRNDTEVNLPGLSLPVQIFVLGVVLAKWDNETAAAASV